MGQLSFIFSEAEQEASYEPDAELSLEERFALWMEGHGAVVYRHFVEIAREIRTSGRERFGGKAIAEIARFRRVMEGKDAEGFKVNNSFVSLMVRKLISEEPSYGDFFELRTLKTGTKSDATP